LIAHVIQPPSALAASGGFGVVDDLTSDDGRQALKEIVPPVSGIEFEHKLVYGDPADGIVSLAEKEGVDLIVMSTHGRSGLMHMLMGSVAESIVRRAPCPVLTLRRPHTTAVGNA